MYEMIQETHYQLAERFVIYRFVSLSLFAVGAPVILFVLWLPHMPGHLLRYGFGSYVRAFNDELRGFYSYLPDGFAGKRRNI